MSRYSGPERRRSNTFEKHFVTVILTVGVMFLGFICSQGYSINNTIIKMQETLNNVVVTINQNKTDALQAIGENRSKINDLVSVVNNHETRITVMESKKK